jgi:hypothetical protein
VHSGGRFLPPRSSIRGAILAAVVSATVVAHVAFAPPIDHHARGRAGTQSVLAALDLMLKLPPSGTDVYITNRRFAASINWDTTAESFSGWAGLFVIAYPMNVIGGRKVHFVEANPQTLSAARAHPGKRIAELLLAPDELPHGARVL